MTYVVSNEGLISDPYALQEFQQIQATLKRIEEILNRVGDPEDPDNGGGGGQPPPGDDGDDPPIIGQRWLTGPWVLGLDGAGIPTRPFYSVVKPPEWDSDQHNFWCNGLDNAVMLEAYPSTSVRLTGIRVAARNRRLLALYNRGAGNLTIVNGATTESSAQYCFSWGDSGDIGEGIIIPSGVVVWLLYDARTQRWKLFAIPPVGTANLPPSFTPSDVVFPPHFGWWGAHVPRGTTTGQRGIGEDNPSTVGTSFTVVDTSEGTAIRSTSVATTGSSAGMSGNSSTSSSLTVQSDPDWVVVLQSPSVLTNLRIWILWNSVAPSNADDIGGASHYFGFRYSTVAGDGGWVGVSRDGTTQSVTSTVGAIAAGGTYRLRARKAGSSIFFSVNDSAEVQHTSNLPGAATTLLWYCQVFTTENVAKNLTWYRHSVALKGSAFVP